METKTLLKRIERYMKREQVGDAAFGRRAASTPNLLPRLRAGSATLKTLQKVDKFLKANKV